MVLKLAARGARCDYGIYLGASEDNYNKIPAICSDAVALKMYLNETYTTLRLDDVSVWMKVSGFLTWHIYMYVRLSFSFFMEHLLASIFFCILIGLRRVSTFSIPNTQS